MVSGPTFGKRFLGLAWVIVLLAGLLGTVAPAAGVVVSPGTLGGFEQDGNFVVNTAGNFLCTYDFPGGNTAAEIRAWRWDGAHWVELTLQPSDVAAATNAAPLTDPLDGNSAVVARGFGEVTLNLLAAGLPADLVGCP